MTKCVLSEQQQKDIFYKWFTNELQNRGEEDLYTLIQLAANEGAEAQRKVAVDMPDSLHADTKSLVLRFASALAYKLHDAEKKYGYSDGWMQDDWMDLCRVKLKEHIRKGDPRDVANYCAFLWYHGEPTTKTPKTTGGTGDFASC